MVVMYVRVTLQYLNELPVGGGHGGSSMCDMRNTIISSFHILYTMWISIVISLLATVTTRGVGGT